MMTRAGLLGLALALLSACGSPGGGAPPTSRPAGEQPGPMATADSRDTEPVRAPLGHPGQAHSGAARGTGADRDADGLADHNDQCPDDPEDMDGYQDSDGCPDPDNDMDGIIDVDDLCTSDPEDRDGFEDEDGCPEPDNDKDRVNDVDDACPNDPETYNGQDDDDGCPDKGRVVLGGGSYLIIFEKVYFEKGKAVLKPISMPILEAAAGILLGNPQLEEIEIQGHSDASEKPALAKQRAETVMKWLIAKGVEAERLKVAAYGKKRPIQACSSCGKCQAKCAMNRRVEFVILQGN